MSTFAITEAAATEIRRISSRRKRTNPVATLYEGADTTHLLGNDFSVGFLEGKRTAAEIRGKLEEVAEQLRYSVRVAVWEHVHLTNLPEFKPEYLHRIGDITFAFEPLVAELLSGYCLTFEEGSFLLRDPHDEVHSLVSVLIRKKDE
jgi:hypothetical protein